MFAIRSGAPPLLATVIALLTGCLGAIDAGGPSDSPGPPNAPPRTSATGGSKGGQAGSTGAATPALGPPGGTVVRRLSSFEYDNTVRELLGETGTPSTAFPPDERRGGFDNDAATLGFSAVFAEQALSVAEGLARGLVARGLARFAPCAATAVTEVCAREFITSFGARAWRRPLQPDEVERILAVFRLAVTQGEGFSRGIEMAATTLLVSLPFLYRVEFGDGLAVAGKPGLVRPTSYEMASRLSYFIWAGPPDDQLFAAAKEEKLKAPADIQRQADRMLGAAKVDPRVRAMGAHFHDAWLGLDGITSANKDATQFPGYAATFPQLLQQETERFLDAAAWDGAGLTDVLTARYSFMNRALGAYYGVGGPTGDAFVRVDLDPRRRGGLLTQGGFLAMLSGFDRTSVVRRGAFVRDKLLCKALPPPPGDVNVTLSPVSSTAGNREIVLAHSRDPSCWGCHQLMDPIGLGFEKYDATGAYRDLEKGRPIDDGGEVIGSPIGKFKGAVELASRLASDGEVSRCFARTWLRQGLGREPTRAVEGDVDRLLGAGGNYRGIMLAITQLDGFLYRPAGPGGSR